MKTMVRVFAVLSIVAFASISMASPQCNHRFSSAGNDRFKDTNPPIAKSSSMDKKGTEGVKKGKR